MKISIPLSAECLSYDVETIMLSSKDLCFLNGNCRRWDVMQIAHLLNRALVIGVISAI